MMTELWLWAHSAEKSSRCPSHTLHSTEEIQRMEGDQSTRIGLVPRKTHNGDQVAIVMGARVIFASRSIGKGTYELDGQHHTHTQTGTQTAKLPRRHMTNAGNVILQREKNSYKIRSFQNYDPVAHAVWMKNAHKLGADSFASPRRGPWCFRRAQQIISQVHLLGRNHQIWPASALYAQRCLWCLWNDSASKIHLEALQMPLTTPLFLDNAKS